MKSFTKFFALIFALGMFTFACQPESVRPKSDSDNATLAAADDDHPTPDPQCSRSFMFDMVNGAGSPIAPSTQGGQDYGQLEVANDRTDLWVILQLGPGWYARLERVWVGLIGDVPINAATNTIATEQFPTQNVITPSRNFFQFTIPGASALGCPSLVIWAEIHRVSPFGQPVNVTVVWGAGTPYLNGWVCNGYCYNPCATFATTATCQYNTNAGSCETIGAEMLTVGGVPPFTWTWADGGTTTGTSASRTVCPTTTTTYTLYFVDSVFARDTFNYQVCVGPNGCGCAPDPVDPPGISANCTNIFTGLPAYVNGGSTCATLTASPSGSYAAPATYQWSNGGNTATISACAAGTYTVTMTDANGSSASSSITITSTNIRCGNSNGNNGAHKVIVCHKPPGNPANVQQICIDWSGVPAHVMRFRAPGSNPNQGHDSGCEIGPCGVPACL